MHTDLIHPFSAEAIRKLEVGQKVRVSGRLFTGRDRLHKFLFEGGACPVDLREGGIYHCGPVMLRDGSQWRVVAAGPTTSARQEPYMARIIEKFQLRLIMGKGGMGDATKAACAAHGCAYLHAVGGAAALLAHCIESVPNVHFLREFGLAEAMWELNVREMEAVVTIDAHGRSLHENLRRASRSALDAALA